MLNKLNKIRNSVNTFDDAEFVSLIGESQVLVKNLNDGSEWAINFSESKDGLLVFDGTSAEQIAEGEKSEQQKFQENVGDLKNTLKAVFSEKHEEAVKALKAKIFELPFYNEEEGKKEPKAEKEEELIAEGKIDAVKNIFEKFQKKVKATDALYNEFAQNGFLFDEVGVKNDKEIVDPIALLEAYEIKQAQRETLTESLDEVVSFEEAVRERYDNEEVIKTILETIEPNSPKAGIQITKALVTAKTKIDNKLDLSAERTFISEAYNKAYVESKKIKQKTILNDSEFMEWYANFLEKKYGETYSATEIEDAIKNGDDEIDFVRKKYKEFKGIEESQSSEGQAINENMAGHTVGAVYNSLNTYPKFRFLKFRTNIYERADVEELANELDRVMAHSYHSLDPDEFQFVNELHTRIMYMSKTNQIDDELVTETIKSFNKRFGKDGKADYNDPDKALGWHGLSKQGEQNAGGEHNPVAVEA